MYISLFVIFSLALILFMLAKDELRAPNYGVCSKNFYNWQNITAFLVFAAVMGVRYNYGVDNLMYIKSYNSFLENHHVGRESYEQGFLWILKFFTLLDAHYSLFIGFFAFVQIFFIYYCVRKNIYYLPFVALYLVLGQTFTTMANLMRQCTAECIFFYLVRYIEERKLWKYIVGVLLCTLIHKSAIILLPLYLLGKRRILYKHSNIMAIMFIACTIIGNTPFWIDHVLRLKNLLILLDYQIYAEHLDSIVDNNIADMNWGPARIGVWLLHITTILIFKDAASFLKLNKVYILYFTLYFFGICFYNLFANTSEVFLRPFLYLIDIGVFVVPMCLYYLYKSRKKLLFTAYCCLSFFFTIYMSIKPFINGNGSESAEVYKFFFLQ